MYSPLPASFDPVRNDRSTAAFSDYHCYVGDLMRQLPFRTIIPGELNFITADICSQSRRGTRRPAASELRLHTRAECNSFGAFRETEIGWTGHYSGCRRYSQLMILGSAPVDGKGNEGKLLKIGSTLAIDVFGVILTGINEFAACSMLPVMHFNQYSTLLTRSRT